MPINRPNAFSTLRNLAGGLILLALTGSIAPPPPAFAPIPPGSDPTDPPAATGLTWSRPVDGLRIRLTTDHATVRSGQSFELEFKMENSDDRTRSVLLPMVRHTILPIAKAPLHGENAMSGDLMITAEQISGDPTPPPIVRDSNSLVQFGSFGLPGGTQVWITVNVNPAGTPPPQTPVRFINNRQQLGGPMLHFQETTVFPGLSRPGKYRLTATFTAGSNGNTRLRTFGDEDSTQWLGRVESEPIELEVLPAEQGK